MSGKKGMLQRPVCRHYCEGGSVRWGGKPPPDQEWAISLFGKVRQPVLVYIVWKASANMDRKERGRVLLQSGLRGGEV